MGGVVGLGGVHLGAHGPMDGTRAKLPRNLGLFFNCTVFEIVCESPRGGHMLLDFILARLVHLKVAFITLGARAVAARG